MSPDPRMVLRPSLLRRLVGGAGADTRPAWEYDTSLRELRQEVMTHLERLLNTRAQVIPELDTLPEAQDSLLTYGLAELSSYSRGDEREMALLCEQVRTTIQRFETRLDPKSVKVRVLPRSNHPSHPGDAEQSDPNDFGIARLQIQAVLHVEPIRADVAFDTRVDMTVGHIEIETAGS